MDEQIYSKEQKRAIFHEWMKGVLSSAKKSLIEGRGCKGDEFEKIFEFNDTSDSDFMCEVKITVKRKGVKDE